MMKRRTPTVLFLFVSCCILSCSFQGASAQDAPVEPAPDPTPADPAATPGDPEDESLIGKLAPNFTLRGTGDSSLRLADAKAGPIVLVFYGADDSQAAQMILTLSRDMIKTFATLGAQFSLTGTSNVESHEALLARSPISRPLFVDPHGDAQLSLGYDPLYPAWAVISTEGILHDADVFEGEDSEAVSRGLLNALAAVRSLGLKNAPNFVGVIGEPFETALDMGTLPDGRVVVLQKDAIIFASGNVNDRQPIDGGGCRALMVDQQGLIYFSAGGELRRFDQPDSWETVLSPSADDDTLDDIDTISPHASAAILTLRGGKVLAVLPATMRSVPIPGIEAGNVVDMVPTPEGGFMVVRNQPPWFQEIDAERQVRVLEPDKKLPFAPSTAVVDDSGRIVVAVRGSSTVYLLDRSARVVMTFPAQGGGVAGAPLLLSAGAGFIDIMVKDDATQKLRILRFM